MKIVVAGVLGGLAMFFWSFIAHTVLPLGEAGIRELPNESAVLDNVQDNVHRAGLYIFPGLGVGENASRQEKHEAMKRLSDTFASRSSGLLLYHPPGRPFAFGKSLAIEFVTELIEVLLAVLLLRQTAIASFAGRVGFVALAGLLAAIVTNVPYWNWYGFPPVYTVSYMFTQVVGFICAGVILALVLRRTAPRTAA